ncbi:MAG: hypothetical protein JJT96_18500, partial [Opitutales bacterium]|nr:hypothetical protein [Opitutales bacterium]
VAAYIDLNPVRAGLVEDAGDYAFSGFGEACAGGSAARRGIARIEGKPTWTTKWHERYRARLCSRMGSGMGPGMRPLRRDQRSAEGCATKETKVPPAGLPEESALLSKIRAFSESWVVGSVVWAESFCAANGWLGFRRARKPQPLVEDGGADFAMVATVVKRQ